MSGVVGAAAKAGEAAREKARQVVIDVDQFAVEPERGDSLERVPLPEDRAGVGAKKAYLERIEPEGRAQRHRDGAKLVDRGVRDRRLGTLRENQGYPVARSDSTCGESVREPVRVGAELAEADDPGDLAPVRDDDRGVCCGPAVCNLDPDVDKLRPLPTERLDEGLVGGRPGGHVTKRSFVPSRAGSAAARKPMWGERRPGCSGSAPRSARSERRGSRRSHPAAPAHRRSRVLSPVRGVVRIRRVGAADPLPDVAGHVQKTVRARAVAVPLDVGVVAVLRPAPDVREGGPRGDRCRVAPWVQAAVDAASCLLPLRLGRQSRAGPPAEGGGVEPVDVGDRVLARAPPA